MPFYDLLKTSGGVVHHFNHTEADGCLTLTSVVLPRLRFALLGSCPRRVAPKPDPMRLEFNITRPLFENNMHIALIGSFGRYFVLFAYFICILLVCFITNSSSFLELSRMDEHEQHKTSKIKFRNSHICGFITCGRMFEEEESGENTPFAYNEGLQSPH